MVNKKVKIQLAKWLLDPDKQQVLPDDLVFLENRLGELGLEKIYREVELPLAPILEEMHKIGIKTDLKSLAKLFEDLRKAIAKAETKIYKLAGQPFNLNSPQQLSAVIFEKLKIESRGVPKRKTGAFSTDAETLEKIKDRHRIVPLIMEYRELFKIYSTYVEPLKKLAGQDKENRIHTTFLQTGTATGRLSSQNPNLQNIPIMSEWGKKLRAAFIAEKGFILASFDYSQIELRVLASVADDTKMIEAFQNDLDIHAMTAVNVFNISIEKVTKDQRRFAKTLNFGVIYGMGPDAFARNTGLSREEAENFIAEYFADFTEVKRWQEKIIDKARQVGYVENLNGRKRWLPNIMSMNRRLSAEAERAAINMPIQGLAADIIKLAMIKASEFLKKNELQDQVRMLLTVHDELIFEIKESLVKKLMPEIKKIMESIYTLKVPLKVDSTFGNNWSELK